MLYKTENPHGGDIYRNRIIYDFSANMNPLGTPESVIKAASDAAAGVCNYPDPYCRKLVSAVAEHEAVDKDSVLCGNGAAELIYSFVFAEKPNKALVTAPAFSEYEAALLAAGCDVQRYILSETNDFDIDMDFVSCLEKTDADCVFICSPNNPTGRLIRPEVLDPIISVCSKRDIRLFADECFLDLSDKGSGDEEYSLKRYLKDNLNIIILRAFTKTYAMPGLRLGYVLSSDHDLLSAMSKSVQTWNVSLPAQAAGLSALGEDEYVEDAKRIIGKERNRLTEALKVFGWHVCTSDANYILFKAFPGLDGMLLKEGIAIKNCSNYPGLSEGWYRTAVRLPEENDVLIAAMKTARKNAENTAADIEEQAPVTTENSGGR